MLMRRLLTGLAIAVLLLLGGVSLLLYTEDMVTLYATYGEAERAGAVRRGWIPAYVPQEAQEILEVHAIDTNQQWLRFKVPEADARVMVRGMQPLSYAEAHASGGKPSRWRGRWPPELERQAVMSPRGPLGLFRAPTPGPGARCVAVEWGEFASVYAWSC